ncbi:MAG: dihydrolipoamide acetyltransferase family protein [Spirochaetota bacterium]|nr:dihydrolipoamide acetyltransferase family protein [Spirochaetota bacterium]
MAEQILMPKLGNSVEECLITEWLKNEGETIAVGDIICTVETDKAAVEVEASAAGVILKILYPEGEEVPVLKPIVIVGKPGEDISDAVTSVPDNVPSKTEPVPNVETPVPGEALLKTKPVQNLTASDSNFASITTGFSSPRARNLAAAEGIDLSAITGTGPSGRIIERDILKISSGNAPASAAAIEKMFSTGGTRPARGSGIGGRVLSSDIANSSGINNESVTEKSKSTEIPVKGVRKIISDLMLKSLTTSAQLTLNSSANAENLLKLRRRLKNSSESLGLNRISVNDLVMFAAVKTLKDYPDLNAHFLGDKIIQYGNINLGIAVDTDRGLMVPVVKNVEDLSLKDFASRNRAVYDRINSNTIPPDELSGATFTVTNLGGLGIESFTPVLNIPEVAILGVNNIQLKPVKKDAEVVFESFIGLSLTFNHQATDGAPAARFMQRLCRNIKDIDLLIAV